MERCESQTVEFKREVCANFCREVVAFANSEGGTIYVGVEDNGDVCGVDDADAAMLRIAGMIESNVEPDVRRYVHIQAKEIEGKTVVSVEVEEGDRKPYCIAQKGYTPAGIYIRMGTSCSHASNELIRAMILDSDGSAFEGQRCREQGLTFTETAAAFERACIPFGPENMRSLGIRDPDGCFTNLGLLLSDQNPFEVRCAVYDDQTPPVFLSRKEFSGSVLKQIDDVLDYFDLINKVSSRFEGYRRADRRDYPPASLREAFLNCMVHRDYGYNGPVILNFYPDRAQFVSIGGLVKGLTVEDVQHGVSSMRNPRLGVILYRLRLIEGYGTGLPTILASYDHTGCEPILDPAPNSFVVALPNLNYGRPTERNTGVGAACVRRPYVLREAVISLRASKEDALVELARNVDEFSRQDAEEYLSAGRDAVLAAINRLISNGVLEKCGNTRATRYRLAKKGGQDQGSGEEATGKTKNDGGVGLPSRGGKAASFDNDKARSIQRQVAQMHGRQTAAQRDGAGGVDSRRHGQCS